MNPESSSMKSPEEKELEKKLEELEALQEQLGQAELDLTTLQVELRDFEKRYLGIVGVKYAELDEIEAVIAERLAAQAPQDRNAHEVTQEARTKAEESARTAGDVPFEEEIQKPPLSPELKKLYRQVAKAVHPDLAEDESDRKRREDLMARANRAYAEGALDELQKILEEAEHSPESVKGQDPALRLIRAIRQISLVEKRLGTIEEETAALAHSDLLITPWNSIVDPCSLQNVMEGRNAILGNNRDRLCHGFCRQVLRTTLKFNRKSLMLTVRELPPSQRATATPGRSISPTTAAGPSWPRVWSSRTRPSEQRASRKMAR